MTSSRGGSPPRILPDFSESSGSRQKSPAAAPGCHPNFPREGRFLQAVLTDQSPLCQQPGPADLGTRHQLQQDRGGWDFRYHFRLHHHHLSSSSEGQAGRVKNFTNFGLQAVSKRKGNWETEGQNPENPTQPTQKMLVKKEANSSQGSVICMLSLPSVPVGKLSRAQVQRGALCQRDGRAATAEAPITWVPGPSGGIPCAETEGNPGHRLCSSLTRNDPSTADTEPNCPHRL